MFTSRSSFRKTLPSLRSLWTSRFGCSQGPSATGSSGSCSGSWISSRDAAPREISSSRATTNMKFTSSKKLWKPQATCWQAKGQWIDLCQVFVTLWCGLSCSNLGRSCWQMPPWGLHQDRNVKALGEAALAPESSLGDRAAHCMGPLGLLGSPLPAGCP